MKKVKTRHYFILAIVIAAAANILLLFLWFNLKLSPLTSKIDELKEELDTREMESYYNSLDELDLLLNNASSKYNIIYFVENDKEEVILGNIDKVNIDFVLFTKMVSVDNEYYLIKIYPNNSLNYTKIFIEIFIFEIVVFTFIFILFYLFTEKTIFHPIDKIIDDIRNYKFGKKPVKKEINNEFGLIQNEFVKLTENLEKEKKEQTRIIASISHDIKTPLTSIIGYSDLINDGDLSKNEIESYNNKINSKAKHIKEILNTFDDYLVSQNNSELKIDVIQIKDLVKDLNDDYKLDLKNKNIEFNINTSIENKYISIDIVKIKRVFSNIISNSTRYLDDNGRIDIFITESNKNIKFVVKDNGPGVKEDIIDKIFDPLFTTDSSRKISGLGLSICKEFVELHGGTIMAYNDNGLIIEFEIPEKNQASK